jgi:DNA polymerase III delta prime subunit
MNNNTIHNTVHNTIPWVEKYRPTTIDDIVLDPLNNAIIYRMLETNYFPNILLYGPPGTGKTTTIINLINSYQKKHNEENKGLMIHLNASDERGIDIIRSQIYHFVNSNSLFYKGTKFVILDEVDYMTKNAQQALKYLLHGFNNNVRFCLICNYISRIDESLQNEFMRIRFNQLPENKIIEFLNTIVKKEELNIKPEKIKYIQKIFNSDIRSMINYIQANQSDIKNNNIINNNIWIKLTNILRSDNYNKATIFINKIISNYKCDIKTLIKDYFNYIIQNEEETISYSFLKFTEFVTHLNENNNNNIISYIVPKLHILLTIST